MPALASVASIAATMAPATNAQLQPTSNAPELTAEDRDINAPTQEDGTGSQPPASPRKPRRTLRKTASTVTVTDKAKTKEKDDQADEKKWVKSTILNLKDRVDDIETMHLSLAEAVRIDHEEAQTEFRSIYRTLQESQVGDLTNLANDPVIVSILNTLQTLQNSVRDNNNTVRENRSAFNKMAALVATCQTREDAMNTLAALQANLEELCSNIVRHATQPAASLGSTRSFAPLPRTPNVLPPMASSPMPPPAMAQGPQPGLGALMGGTPLPITPIHSTLPLIRPTAGIPTASPGASFNPPLSSIAKGKRAADKLADRGSPKKQRLEPTVLVLVGYTEASGHPTSIAQSIIQTLNLSAHDLVTANWKKTRKGSSRYVPELYGLSAEVMDEGEHFTGVGMGQPGPSNPGPSTRLQPVPDDSVELNLASWNINGNFALKSQYEEIVSLIEKHDVVVFQETWLMPDEHNTIKLPQGYDIVSAPRDLSNKGMQSGGGVAIVYKAQLARMFKVRHELCTEDLIVLDLS
ncbi:hypothetical protein PQX77_021071 [Marasmius sp. AFHP31]|nr:hypothetical protein PQX77_021071 [Marasmius sp. AFHP31]